MSLNKIVFHYDCVSPWSFVGFEVLKRYKRVWNLDVEYRAVNQGYIMKFSANKPPMAVPNKGAYMHAEMERQERFTGLKLQMPSDFPVNTMYMQMVLRTIQDDAPSQVEDSMSACFLALWKHDAPCKTEQDMVAILSPVLGQGEAEKIVHKAFTGDAKAKLNKETQVLATEGGAFGVPWFIVTRPSDGEQARFFGSDRFEHIAAFLGLAYKGPFADGVTPKL